MKTVIALLVTVMTGCASPSTTLGMEAQHCKVYGLKAYQENDRKKFKEIHIKDCKAVDRFDR